MITIDAAQVQEAIRNMSAYVDGTQTVLDAIGNNLKIIVQRDIEAGGRPAWAPLSVWTHMRTGRTKPLESLAQRITYTADKQTATVFFVAPSPYWNITQHETGWITPERWGHPVMVVPMADGGKVFFRHAKASVIPARPVWPDAGETEELVMNMVYDWILAGVIDKWHG